MEYIYSIIRYVPNPTIGEFVNLGIIAGSDATREWDAAWPGSRQRARNLGNAMGASSHSILDTIVEQTQARLRITREQPLLVPSDGPTVPFSETLLEHMHIHSANVIQYSKPLPIAAPSLAEAISRIEGLLFARSRRQVKPRQTATKGQLIGKMEGALDRVLAGSATQTQHNPSLWVQNVTETPDLVVLDETQLYIASAWSFFGSHDEQARQLQEIKSLLLFLVCLDMLGHRLTLGEGDDARHYQGVDAFHTAVVLEAPPEEQDQDFFGEASWLLETRQVPQF